VTTRSQCSTVVLNTVVTATRERQNWGCQNSESLEPTGVKFCVGYYIGDVNLHAKYQSSRPSGGGPGKWVKYYFRTHTSV